jgi:hypothetical protein
MQEEAGLAYANESPLANRKIITTILALPPDLIQKPPHRRVIEQDRLTKDSSDSLSSRAAYMCTFVRKDCLHLHL